MKSILLKTLSGIFLSLFMLVCTTNEPEFQKFEPDLDFKLSEIPKNIPVIKSIFRNIDLSTVNAGSGGSSLQIEPAKAVKTLMMLAELSKKPLPDLIDAIAYSLNQLYLHYQFQPDEFNNAFHIGTDILNVRKEGFVDVTDVLADVILHFGNDTDLFPGLVLADYFPDKSIWGNCDEEDPGYDDFAQSNIVDNPPNDPQRKSFLDLYSALRVGQCLFKNSTATPGEEPGEFVYNYLVAMRDAGLSGGPQPEDKIQKLIDYIKNNLHEINDFERNLADWLVKDPEKKFITDFLTNELYSMAKKNSLFDDLKPILDLTASFLSAKDPSDTNPDLTQRKYLLEWFVEALKEDVRKISMPEFPLEIDTSIPIMKYMNDLVGDPSALNWKSFSLKKSLSLYGNNNINNGVDKLVDILWDGWTFYGRDSNRNNKGIMFNNGTVEPPNSGAAHTVPFRMLMHDRLNGNGDGVFTNDGSNTNPPGGMQKSISYTYNGENSGQAGLTNLFLHNIDRYYSPVHKKWAFNESDAIEFFCNNNPVNCADRTRNLQRFLGNLQYSLRNFAVMDKHGNNPWDAGFETTPLLTVFLYIMGVTNGAVAENTIGQRLILRSGLNNMGSELAKNGAVDSSFMGLGPAPRLFCDGSDCSKGVNVYRNGIPWNPNLDMGTVEAFSPGRFLQRSVSAPMGNPLNPGDWAGMFSPQQADLENSDFIMGAWLNSVLPVNLWLGYGLYTVRGRAPNGGGYKYKNDYYTDSYQAHLQVKVCKGLCLTPDYEWVNVAMGNNTGEVRHAVHRDDWDDNNIRADEDNSDRIIRVSNSTEYGGKLGANGQNARGNLHIFEKYYRPMGYSDPCGALAKHPDAPTGASYWAKYAFRRPSLASNYHDNTQCTNWMMVQVDFDNREEAIRNNFTWLMNDRKIVAIVPVAGTDRTIAGGVAFANFYIVMGNGLMGLLRGRSVGGFEENGRWNFFSNECPPDRPGCNTCDPAAKYAEWVAAGSNPTVPLECPYGSKYYANNPGAQSEMTCGEEPYKDTNENKDYNNGEPFTDSNNNGVWDSNGKCSFNMVNSNNNGLVGYGNGIVKETASPGATLTHRLYRSSFEVADSASMMLITMSRWGIISDIDWLTDAVDLYKSLFGKLGTDPMQPGLLLDNAQAMETLPRAQYEQNDILCTSVVTNAFFTCDTAHTAAENTSTEPKLAKFRKFYDSYIKTDILDANMNYGADGKADLWQHYLISIQSLTLGCLYQPGHANHKPAVPPELTTDDSYKSKNKVPNCITAKEMPPVPLVYGVSYPETYTANGSVNTWYTYSGPSDGQFTPILVPVGILGGTSFEGGDVYEYVGSGNKHEKCLMASNDPPVFQSGGNCRVLPAGTAFGLDPNQQIKGFLRTGFREKVLEGPAMIVALNESKKDNSTNYPVYSSQVLLNALIENTQGARNGFLPELFSSKYFNLSLGNFLKKDLNDLVAGSFRKFFDNLQLFNNINGAPNTNLQKLRYFLSDKALVSQGDGGIFTTNLLESIPDPNPNDNIPYAEGKPINLLKFIFNYARQQTSDGQIVFAIKQGVKALNKYYHIRGMVKEIQISDSDIDGIIEFLNSREPDGAYTLDSFLDFINDNDLTDITNFTNPQLDTVVSFIDKFKEKFDSLNKKVIDNFNQDLRKNICYGLLIDEPYHDANSNNKFDSGESYLDFNKNGKFDSGKFTFRDFYPDEMFRDTVVVDGNDVIVQTKIPNFFNYNAYDIRLDLQSQGDPITRTQIFDALDKVANLDFFKEINSLKDKLISNILDKNIDEPSKDRDQDGVIRNAEPYLDGNNNSKYDIGEIYTDLNGNGIYDEAEYDDVNGDGIYNKKDCYNPFPVDENNVLQPQKCEPQYGDPYLDENGNGRFDGAEVFNDENFNGVYNLGEKWVDRNNNGQWDNELFGEQHTDVVKNDVYDLGESFTDANGNGKWDYGEIYTDAVQPRYDGPISLRKLLKHKTDKLYEKLVDINNNKTIRVAVRALNHLMTPKCSIYSADVASCNSVANGDPNPGYVTNKLLAARTSLMDSIDFQPVDLTALKNVFGNFLVDRQNNTYTFAISNISFALLPVLYLVKGEVKGNVDNTIELFKKDGIMRHVLGNMSLEPPNQAIDVFREIDYLLRFKSIRKSNNNTTMWFNLNKLLTDLATLAYTQNNMDFALDPQCYSSFTNLFASSPGPYTPCK